MQAIIYTRTSTNKQELGHQAQLDSCTRWAASQDLDVKAVFCDTISGTKPMEDREGLTGAINSLSKGDVLVVYRRDRLGRDIINNAVCERLIKRKGASIHSLDIGSNDTAEGALLATLLDAFAQYERAVIAMRTKATIQSIKERGLCYGSPELGYKTVIDEDGIKRHVKDDEESAKIERVRTWRAEGLAYVEITARCAEEGILTRKGNVPELATLRRWCVGVEMPKKVQAEKKRRDNSKVGRPAGTRGSRTLDNDSGLRLALIQCLEANMKQAEIVRTLASNGIVNSTGNPYGARQIRRFISYLRQDGLIA